MRFNPTKPYKTPIPIKWLLIALGQFSINNNGPYFIIFSLSDLVIKQSIFVANEDLFHIQILKNPFFKV